MHLSNFSLNNSENATDMECDIPLSNGKSPVHQEHTNTTDVGCSYGKAKDALLKTSEENNIGIPNSDDDDNSRDQSNVAIFSSETVYIESPSSSNGTEATSEMRIISTNDIKSEITCSPEFAEEVEEDGFHAEKVDNVIFTSPESLDITVKRENIEEQSEIESMQHTENYSNTEENVGKETTSNNNIVLGTYGSTFNVADIYLGISSKHESLGNDDVDNENKDSIHDAERKFQCRSCGKRFHSRANLLRHEVVHTGKKGYPCSICGKEFSREYNLTTHRRIHTEEKDFKCDICGKGFYWKSCLTRHMGVHTDKDDFTCHICGKVFFNKSYVLGHMVVHTKEKVFKCDICGKGFSFKVSLRKHRVMHTNQKDFKCDICGKEFFQKSNLNLHRVVHTVVREFKCDICEKVFTSKANLTYHIALHTGEYTCEICGRTFTRGKSLLLHKAKHNNSSVTEKPSSKIKGTCELCGKTFSRKSHLTLHMVVHSGERNFKCDVCGKSFFHRFNLVQHRAIHTGNIKCTICGKVFSRKSRLRDHLKIHTPEKSLHMGGIFSSTNLSSEGRSDLLMFGSFQKEHSDPVEEITIKDIKTETTEAGIYGYEHVKYGNDNDYSPHNCNILAQNENEDTQNHIDSCDNISTSSKYSRSNQTGSANQPTFSSFGTIPALLASQRESTSVSQNDGVNLKYENQNVLSHLSVLRYFMALRAGAQEKTDQISANQAVENYGSELNIEAYVGNNDVYSSGPDFISGSILPALQERMLGDISSARTVSSYADGDVLVLGSPTEQLDKRENAKSILASRQYDQHNRCAAEIEEIYIPATIEIESDEINENIIA